MLAPSYKQALLDHYDTEEGVGNAYILVAEWPTALKASLLGWEKVLDHPAAVHYARDFAGQKFNEALKRTGYETFDKLGLSTGKVLDCGCGVGGTTLSLGLKYPTMSFVGISISPGQIRTAINRASLAKCHNVSYEVGNYLNLPFTNDAFDGILGIETFCHVEDKDKDYLFSELKRVLKKGGRVVISDAFLNSRPSNQMTLPDLHSRIFKGWTLPEKISTREFFCTRAKEAGFIVESETDLTERILGCSLEASKRAKLLKPLTPVAKLLIRLKRFGISLPVFSRLGLDREAILEFAYTSELQYDMFKNRDTEYFEIVLRKP